MIGRIFHLLMKIPWFTLIIVAFRFHTVQLASAVSKSGNYAVIRGQRVMMSCLPPEVQIDESTVNGQKSFVWTDEEGKEIVNPRMERLVSGELQINRAYEGDSGVYHCKFRPRKAFQHAGAESRIFEHKLIVYELSGHKFETLVTFDVTKFGSEATITSIRDLMKSKICATELCAPGPVESRNCEVTETENQLCEMSITYEAIEFQQNSKCNEVCVRTTMIERLKKAQKLLESSLLTYSEDSKSRLKPIMGTYNTKHITTCKAGYHLIELNYEHCFPCLPGYYSEAETLRCDMCPIGFYQEKYGSHDCEQCLDNLTTETVGSKSKDDCRLIAEIPEESRLCFRERIKKNRITTETATVTPQMPNNVWREIEKRFEILQATDTAHVEIYGHFEGY